ncbi:Slp family lipoprotein [Natronorubrum halophilum]|uniref:Slp family lipoprotein n=1 Tax=Natronorubrum halophilum TaxID=1702106 RepID=UPI001EE866C3|nr:Slp family lipoprotein [Natronorubrum halophilum]
MQFFAGQRGRLLAGVVLGALLGGCLLWAGATPGDPLESAYPDEVEVTPTPEAYVGEQVVLGGRVVDTDPVVIATRASGYGRFTLVNADDRLQNADGPLERGDRVTAFGTLEADSTLVVERTTTRKSSETGYMLAVSAIAGLWVAGRFIRGWRFDRATLAFIPRERSSKTADQSSRRQGSDRSGRSQQARTRQNQRARTDGGDRRA